ncbi:ankyrin repeat domain-containing protein 49-like [Gigantopelta aegis]|uniref:ankyrin repeat domain-containing protein 49-like n=1 Tax=Gigantopelta aegis TaxID=1735272 RepID=UPI001B88B5CD|nr:ankyrin repeat domain-containing protein 49-like [Gigantopelta aegis]
MAEPDDLEEIYPEREQSNVNAELFAQILQAKKGEPNKFNSYWEDDDDDVDVFTKLELESDPAKRILTAAEKNLMTVVQSLLAQQPSLVNSRDNDQYTPLHRASYNNHADMVEYLLTHGADIHARTIDGWHPLHSACRWNSASAALVLISSGADINSRTQGGLTPLHLAASERDSHETLELLLMNRSVDASIKTQLGETAKQICERMNNLYVLFELVDDNINILK